MVDIVNDRDEAIGTDLKSRKAERGFISRVAAVILLDSRHTSGLCPEDTAKEWLGKPLVFQDRPERSSCIPRRYEAKRVRG